jgi:hypothetical protein
MPAFELVAELEPLIAPNLVDDTPCIALKVYCRKVLVRTHNINSPMRYTFPFFECRLGGPNI